MRSEMAGRAPMTERPLSSAPIPAHRPSEVEGAELIRHIAIVGIAGVSLGLIVGARPRLPGKAFITPTWVSFQTQRTLPGNASCRTARPSDCFSIAPTG